MAEFVAKNGNAGLFLGSGSPLSYTKIVGVKSFNWGAISAEEKDVTDFDSPSGYREFLSGLKAAAPGTIVLNYDPRNTQQMALRTAQGGAALYFQALTDDEEVDFQALVLGFDTPIQVGEVPEATVTIKLTGAPTYASAS